MDKNQKKRHDNRPHNWCVSLSEYEFEMVENRCKETGLKKSVFTRQALMSGTIISSVEKQDRAMANGLLKMHRDINEIAAVVQRLNNEGQQKANSSVASYLKKVESKFEAMDESLAKATNYISSKMMTE